MLRKLEQGHGSLNTLFRLGLKNGKNEFCGCSGFGVNPEKRNYGVMK